MLNTLFGEKSSDFFPSNKIVFFAKRTKIRGLSFSMFGCWGRTMKDLKGVTNNKGHVVFFYCLFFSGRWNLLIFSTSGASFGGMQPNLVWVLLFVRFTGGRQFCTFLPDTEIAPFGYGIAVSWAWQRCGVIVITNFLGPKATTGMSRGFASSCYGLQARL